MCAGLSMPVGFGFGVGQLMPSFVVDQPMNFVDNQPMPTLVDNQPMENFVDNQPMQSRFVGSAPAQQPQPDPDQ